MDLTKATLSDLSTMRNRNVGEIREAAIAELERRAGGSGAGSGAVDVTPAEPVEDHTAEAAERAQLEAEQARIAAELAALPPEVTP